MNGADRCLVCVCGVIIAFSTLCLAKGQGVFNGAHLFAIVVAVVAIVVTLTRRPPD